MNANQLQVTGAGLFYLSIFLSGFWLSRSGKPYNTIVFSIHKLTALAAVILFIKILYRTNRLAPLSTVELIASAVSGLLFLCLFITGSLLSIDKPMPAAISAIHKLFPYFTVLSTVAILSLLLNRKS